MATHAVEGRLVADLERTSLNDIRQTWERASVRAT
jgi:hypothetical protein